MTITDDEELFTITQEDENDTGIHRDNYTDDIPPESSEEEPLIEETSSLDTQDSIIRLVCEGKDFISLDVLI